MQWDVAQYIRYAGERGRPFVDLIARIDAPAPRSVIDLGCGPGNLTALLADRWPADALPPFKVDPQPAPDIAWLAWLGAAVSPETAPARPYYLRAPDAKPQKDLLQKAAQPSAS